MFLQVQIKGVITNNWYAEYYHTPDRRSSYNNKPSTNDNFETACHSLISHLITHFFLFLRCNNILVLLNSPDRTEFIYLKKIFASLHKSINLGKNTALIKNPSFTWQLRVHSTDLQNRERETLKPIYFSHRILTPPDMPAGKMYMTVSLISYGCTLVFNKNKDATLIQSC